MPQQRAGGVVFGQKHIIIERRAFLAAGEQDIPLGIVDHGIGVVAQGHVGRGNGVGPLALVLEGRLGGEGTGCKI